MFLQCFDARTVIPEFAIDGERRRFGSQPRSLSVQVFQSFFAFGNETIELVQLLQCVLGDMLRRPRLFHLHRNADAFSPPFFDLKSRLHQFAAVLFVGNPPL